jgi:hypothetical protein
MREFHIFALFYAISGKMLSGSRLLVEIKPALSFGCPPLDFRGGLAYPARQS